MEVIHITHPHQLNIDRTASSVAFGNFDGLHQGHQQVIKQAVQIAKKNHVQAGILTFHPSPKEVLGKVQESTYLTPLPDKLRLLEEMGLDFTIIVQFTPLFSTLSPKAFIDQYIIDLNIKNVVTGFDFCFGNQGKGTIETLQQWSKATGQFDVYVLPSIDARDEKISTSRVRELLWQGEIEKVTSLLNRYYQVSGVVIHGQKRGREIGFPTANLKLKDSYVLPKRGVYAVLVRWQNRTLSGVCNIGIKPTFQGTEEQPTIEVYIFNFEHHLYDQPLDIQFISYLRAEQKFQSVDHLTIQIKEDIKNAKQKLNLIN